MFRSGSIRTIVLLVILIKVSCIPVCMASSVKKDQVSPVDKSDLTRDLVVDESDLALFGAVYLHIDWTDFDWCGFRDAAIDGVNFADASQTALSVKSKPPAYYKKHFTSLLDFVNDYCGCDLVPLPHSLQLANDPRLLLRMTMSKDGSGDIYITDPLVGSVYFYDTELLPRAELKDLNRPLGVAIDQNGYLLVGNDGRDNVEVYDLLSGEKVTEFGQDRIIMPNSITVDADGYIFVTDSRAHRVWMYDAAYNYISNIGSPGTWENELYFPVDTQVIERYIDGQPVKEVFVADQGNERIQVFDVNGGILRHIYPGKCGMGGCLPPRLANLQSLDVDSLGRLHALDNFEAVVSILDPETGGYLGEYGEYGDGPGQLRVPFGLVITDSGQSVVTSGDGTRIEVFSPH